MRGDLHYIFLGKRARSFEQGDEYLVNDFFPITNRTQMDGMGGLLLQVFSEKHFVAYTNGVFA